MITPITMQSTIPLFLTFATLCLSFPYSNTPPTATLVAKHVTSFRKGTLTLPVSTRQSGLNFSPCNVTTQICKGDRACLTFVDEAEFMPCDGSACICFPQNLASGVFCDSNGDCEIGETCTHPSTVDSKGLNFCMANEVAGFLGNPVSPSGPPPSTIPPSTAGIPPPAPTGGSAAQPVSPGLSFDRCQSDANCQVGRPCLNIPSFSSCNTNDCRCIPPRLSRCSSLADCENGEECRRVADIMEVPFIPVSDRDQFRACASRSALEQITPPPCIGVGSLRHISREELVFENDIVAHVLCDLNESCATRGHMVRYKGKGMMMKTYCQLTACVKKIVKVNSPKYRRGLTVESRTGDLVFTAMSARFESRAEEMVLSTAVRLGF